MGWGGETRGAGVPATHHTPDQLLEALRDQVAPMGLEVTLDRAGRGLSHAVGRISAYETQLQAVALAAGYDSVEEAEVHMGDLAVAVKARIAAARVAIAEALDYPAPIAAPLADLVQDVLALKRIRQDRSRYETLVDALRSELGLVSKPDELLQELATWRREVADALGLDPRTGLGDQAAGILAAARRATLIEDDSDTPAQAEPEDQPADRADSVRRVLEALRDRGPQSVSELAIALGLDAKTIRKACRALCDSEEITEVGKTTGRGRPAPIYGLPASPEPPLAPVPDDPDDPSEIAIEDPDDEAQPAADRRSSTPQAVEHQRRIAAALADGPLTNEQLVEATGFSQGRVVHLCARMRAGGRIEARGKDGAKALWHLLPLPHEQESVTIRQSTRVERRDVLAVLAEEGTASAMTVARKLGVSAVDVFLTLSQLSREGLAERLPHEGKYRVVESASEAA